MTKSDLISRADAIEEVCSVVIDEFDVSPTRGYEVAEKALSALPSAEAVQEWISCSERLPKKGEVVLITNGKGNVRCGQYRSEHDVRGGTHYWWWKGKTVESVLAWRPLPEPYKGGDDE